MTPGDTEIQRVLLYIPLCVLRDLSGSEAYGTKTEIS